MKPTTQSQVLSLGKRRREKRPVAETVAVAGERAVAERDAGGTGEPHRAITLTELVAGAGRTGGGSAGT